MANKKTSKTQLVQAFEDFILALALILILAALVMLGGCSEPTRRPAQTYGSRPVAGAMSRQCAWPTTVFCDPELPKISCERLKAAAEYWNLQAPASAFFTFGGISPTPDHVADLMHNAVWVTYAPPEKRLKLSSITDGKPHMLAVTMTWPHATTQCRARAVMMQFVQDGDFQPDDLESVLIHELGHVLGLPDLDTDGCVMNGTADLKSPYPPILCERERNLIDALYAP
jgi:hypothetical protein